MRHPAFATFLGIHGLRRRAPRWSRAAVSSARSTATRALRDRPAAIDADALALASPSSATWPLFRPAGDSSMSRSPRLGAARQGGRRDRRRRSSSCSRATSRGRAAGVDRVAPRGGATPCRARDRLGDRPGAPLERDGARDSRVTAHALRRRPGRRGATCLAEGDPRSPTRRMRRLATKWRSTRTANGARSGSPAPCDDFPLGRERTTSWSAFARSMVSTREILEIGEEQLAEHRGARAAIAREIDPSASEALCWIGSRPTIRATSARPWRAIAR